MFCGVFTGAIGVFTRALNSIHSREERIATARHFRVFPGEGVHSAALADLVVRLDRIGYQGDYSFEVFNDDYRQLQPATVAQRARRSAVMALLAVLEVPLVHYSVKWWRPLHQNETVEGGKLHGLMLFTLFVGLIAFTLLYVWLVMHRQRVLALNDQVDDHGLDAALAARREES